jgi:hypothetical protein
VSQEIRVDQTLPFPVEQVFTGLRDRLPELAPLIPGIAQIAVVERKELGEGVISLHNKWTVSRDMPDLAIIGRFLPDGVLYWEDHALWDPRDRSCTWRFVLPFVKEAVEVGGKNHYREDGGATRLEVRGALHLALERVPGVPRLLARAISPVVERKIIDRIEPSFRRTGDALAELLRRDGTKAA